MGWRKPFLIALWLLLLTLTGTAGAESVTFTYAGFLSDANGNALDGDYQMEFRLYDSASGGNELDSYSATVSVTGGYFSQDVSFDREYFDGRSLWMEIEVNGETLSPRMRLGEVPYASGLKPGIYVTGTGSYLACFNNTDGSRAEFASSEEVYSISPPILLYSYKYGVKGEAENGWGVLGYSHFNLTYGMSVAGVYGEYDNSVGMLGTKVGGLGTGVYGKSGDVGVYGSGDTGVKGTGSKGVYGHGSDYGVYGESDEVGVYGHGYDSGVVGSGVSKSYPPLLWVYYTGYLSANTTIDNKKNILAGVVGTAYSTSALGSGVSTYACLAANVDDRSYAYYGEGYFYNIGTGNFTGDLIVQGDLEVKGTKNFVMPHPTDPSKKIYYTSLEGPEAGIYVRGTAKLEDGYAVVELPDHFSLVASGEITAQVTAKIDNGRFTVLNVEEVTADHLTVRGVYLNGKPSNAEFDYVVYAERAGYENYEPVR